MQQATSPELETLVITSYSIHYTKLYDESLGAAEAAVQGVTVPLGVDVAGVGALRPRLSEHVRVRRIETLVITSYSIHYTTLYEL